MVTYTTAKSIALVANSSYVGTWDQPTNANWGIVDAALGQLVAISLNNSNVTLSAAQFQCSEITFNSTLTGSVVITFPTSVTGPYVIENVCTGSSLYTITLATTAASGKSIALPPGEIVDIFNTGTDIKFRNFGRIGSYMDYAGSSVPAWITACTVPPYLNCDGTAFSSATYPALANLIGTTLPDSKGRYRLTLDQGATRVTSAVSGMAGNTLLAGGGDQNTQTHNHTATSSDSGHTHTLTAMQQPGGANSTNGTGTIFQGNTTVTTNSGSAVITTTVANYGSGTAQNIPPSYAGGLTLIRAA